MIFTWLYLKKQNKTKHTVVNILEYPTDPAILSYDFFVFFVVHCTVIEYTHWSVCFVGTSVQFDVKFLKWEKTGVTSFFK